MIALLLLAGLIATTNPATVPQTTREISTDCTSEVRLTFIRQGTRASYIVQVHDEVVSKYDATLTSDYMHVTSARFWIVSMLDWRHLNKQKVSRFYETYVDFTARTIDRLTGKTYGHRLMTVCMQRIERKARSPRSDILI